MKWLLSILLFCSCFGDKRIHDHGYWIGSGRDILFEHKFDPNLADALCDFFITEGASSLVDFGCGPGAYLKFFRARQLPCIGYDGNPFSADLSAGLVKVIDLAEPFDLKEKFDWVLCLEVGEHIPKEYETTLLENLDRHIGKGIVLSWAIKGQGGFGHFNCQDNIYIRERMYERGYKSDYEAEEMLRMSASLPWFKNTIMVFRKIDK